MLKTWKLTFSLQHGSLCEFMPKEHLLQRIATVVDFWLANEKIADLTCWF